MELFSDSPEETEVIGERIASKLSAGAVVALRGDIGAGKTCLVKGIARGLGVEDTVTSPTYTVVSEYQGDIPVFHIDAYRLSGDDDFEDTGAHELLGAHNISLVEWSERIPRSLPAGDITNAAGCGQGGVSGTITVTIQISGLCSRIIRISGLESLDERK
ncbi:MAG: tRNA (adenosine(37)-N6)-threonylcarbamoyltransferase complex ATPase subunit type 1 TsaE [Treponema sp.]|nr:tRNA (adenosine(37)-N6)-threonylcarbamoyltransferase complex ATPase subunit type 1 TsaE [Treponema sp.]